MRRWILLLGVLTACGGEATVEGSSGQAPPGMLGCGPAVCAIADEYCMIYRSDQGEPDESACTPFSSECASDRDCDCLVGDRLGLSCEGDAESGLTLTSLGG